MQRILIAFLIGLVGCLHPQAVDCADGTICPGATVCDTSHHLCVTQGQLDACTGQPDGTACTADPIAGFCTGGVCLSQICGDAIVVGTEVCDDGNQRDGDGCSGNCSSTETCGNNTIDTALGEQCDDGNLRDHDGCSSTCKLETAHWLQHSIAPLPRVFSAVATDTRRDRIVVFGGNIGGFTDDTLEWTGIDWVTMKPTVRPTPRPETRMAYDQVHQVMVLFGGGSNALRDTWLWDGASWTNVDDTGAVPPARYGHVMAYDPRRHVVVMFGGTDGADTPHYFDDTWEWDGTSWTANTSATHPTGRADASAVYDPILGATVLTGGHNGTDATDTWTYDGTWHDVTNGANPKGSQFAMAFDEVGQRIVLFGGTSISPPSVLGATWTWNGSSWTNLGTLAGPAAHAGWMLASTTTRLVLYGGVNPQPKGETWFFSPQNVWSQPPSFPGRSGMGIANDPVHARAVFYGGVTSPPNGIAADTWVLSPSGFVLAASAPPSEQSGPSMAFDPIARDIVMLGINSASLATETWLWSGAGWAQRTPATSPAPRSYVGVAFDGQHVTVIGGDTLGDVQSWNGTTWLSGPAARPGSTGQAAGYDPIRNELVSFGGSVGAPIYYDDTWTYGGDVLTQQMPSFSPSPRFGASLVWNPARERLTLLCGFAPLCDSFEWDGAHWHVVPVSNPPSSRIQGEAFTSLDGTGVMYFGGAVGTGISPPPLIDERWELRWDGPGVSEACDDRDLDGDGLVGCADPDCWPICAPLCPPGATCDPTAPRCGDGVCDPQRETCATCPADCTGCAPICGDGRCSTGETCPGDCP